MGPPLRPQGYSIPRVVIYMRGPDLLRRGAGPIVREEQASVNGFGQFGLFVQRLSIEHFGFVQAALLDKGIAETNAGLHEIRLKVRRATEVTLRLRRTAQLPE